MIAGENQSKKIRENYLAAILKQEITCFYKLLKGFENNESGELINRISWYLLLKLAK